MLTKQEKEKKNLILLTLHWVKHFRYPAEITWGTDEDAVSHGASDVKDNVFHWTVNSEGVQRHKLWITFCMEEGHLGRK